MNKKYIIIISSFLLFVYGCKKETDDVNWTINEIVVTFRLEYDSINQLIKYSYFRNNALHYYVTFNYSDTSLIQKNFNINSVETAKTVYLLDSNIRAVKSISSYTTNNIDTIEYSSSGFPRKIKSRNSDTLYFKDNGEDIISENVFVLFSNYAYSEALSKVSLPDDFMLFNDVIPSFTGAFGSVNQHLVSSTSGFIGGPGSSSYSSRFEYTFDLEDYVTEVKKYHKSTPQSGTISIFKYEYIFE